MTNANNGHIDWSYSIADNALDFLAAGETLILTSEIVLSDGTPEAGKDLRDTTSVQITITGTNDAPTLSAGVLAATLEDSNGTAECISDIFANQFGDVDHGASLAGIAVTDADTGGTGAWWYSDNGSNWSQIGSVSAGSALVLSASAYLKFVPAPDYNGTPPALTVYAIDDTYSGSFSSGNGGPAHTDLSQASSHGGSTPFAQDSTSITTSVTAVNDAPVNTIPDKQCVDEDTALVFNCANDNGISISDVDANGGNQTVTLTVSHGVLTLSQITGLTFETGSGTGDSTMTFTGKVSDINAALEGLSYTGALNFNGCDTLTIATGDNGNTGVGGPLGDTDSIKIDVVAVNDAPVITSNGGGATASVSIVENGTTVTTVTAADVDSANRTYSIVDDYGTSPDADKFTINPTTGALSFIAPPDYETYGSADESNDYVVTVKVCDGDGGEDLQTITVKVTDDPEVAAAPTLVAQTLLGGAGEQAAADVSYANGHLYLTYGPPQTSSTSDNSTVVGFSTAADEAPTQDFSLLWDKGFLNGVGSDGTNVYAVGSSHPGDGLTSDGVGDPEVKTLLATFNADGTPGSSPPPAIDYAANNFFSYRGVEMFQNVLVTTQNSNTVLYAVGMAQPASNGAYVIASYDSSGNLLHNATDPLWSGYSIAHDAVEFNGQVWAVGYSNHGDPVGRATAWAANYELNSVATYQDTLEIDRGQLLRCRGNR